MRASPYIGPFEDRVRIWESKLNLTQDIVDQWLKCQQVWLYLEPIFGSDDIMSQLVSFPVFWGQKACTRRRGRSYA